MTLWPVHPSKPGQSGLALVAVLWVVAALALMVMGISHVLRTETRLTHAQQSAGLDAGVADAAIRVVLAQLHQQGRIRHSHISSQNLQLFNRDVVIDIIPLNGWINLNHAPASLLTDALVHAGGLGPDTAQAMAQVIVQKREQADAQGKPMLFQGVEDLMQIPGLSWDQYIRLFPLFTTALGNDSVLPNPLAAPLEVLNVLAQGQIAVAQRITEQRQGSAPDTTDTTALNGAHYQRSDTQSVEIRATLGSGDNTALIRTWRVALGTPDHGLPWRVLAIDPIRKNRMPHQP